MKKLGWIVAIVAILLIIVLVWGYWGKLLTDSEYVCDFGIKEKIVYDSSGEINMNDGEVNAYLCWTWHKYIGPIISNEEKEEINQLFGAH